MLPSSPCGGGARDSKTIAGKNEESSKKLQPHREYESFAVDIHYLDRKVRIGKALPMPIKQMVQATLTEFWDIFSWTPVDLSTISGSTAIHMLRIPEARPAVIQKKRTFARPRQQVIRDSVNELLEVGITKHIDYPVWLANLVVYQNKIGSGGCASITVTWIRQ